MIASVPAPRPSMPSASTARCRTSAAGSESFASKAERAWSRPSPDSGAVPKKIAAWARSWSDVSRRAASRNATRVGSGSIASTRRAATRNVGSSPPDQIFAAGGMQAAMLRSSQIRRASRRTWLDGSSSAARISASITGVA